MCVESVDDILSRTKNGTSESFFTSIERSEVAKSVTDIAVIRLFLVLAGDGVRSLVESVRIDTEIRLENAVRAGDAKGKVRNRSNSDGSQRTEEGTYSAQKRAVTAPVRMSRRRIYCRSVPIMSKTGLGFDFEGKNARLTSCNIVARPVE